MDIKTIVTGYLDENCYVLSKNNTCLVIDPGDDYDKIVKEIGDDKILAVLITHSHFDHIGALRNFLVKKSIKIFKRSNCEEKEYTIGDFNFSVIHTPGHSKDSITFYFVDDNIMFDGDFIFKESIGRSDLPGGSTVEMKSSIDKIKKYPLNTTLYPGHGESTTLEYELDKNLFLL